MDGCVHLWNFFCGHTHKQHTTTGMFSRSSCMHVCLHSVNLQGIQHTCKSLETHGDTSIQMLHTEQSKGAEGVFGGRPRRRDLLLLLLVILSRTGLTRERLPRRTGGGDREGWGWGREQAMGRTRTSSARGERGAHRTDHSPRGQTRAGVWRRASLRGADRRVGALVAHLLPCMVLFRPGTASRS
jgi:hypothetical protein